MAYATIDKLNFCASISAPSQSRFPLCIILKNAKILFGIIILGLFASCKSQYSTSELKTTLQKVKFKI